MGLPGADGTTVNLGATYDYNGDMTSLAANIGGTSHFDYTTTGSGAFTDFTDGVNDFVNSYTYDPLGDLSSIAQTGQSAPTDGTANSVVEKGVSMSYDGDQRLIGLETSQSGTTVAAATMTYDADSDLTNLTYTDGSDNTLAAYHFDYNAAGAVTDEYSRKDSDSTSLQSTYEAGDSNWAKTSYSYDADAQLTGATYSSNYVSAPTSFSAAYDPNGNRTSTGDTSADRPRAL